MSRWSGAGRSDLVIGLTLAEVFLLLLFVVWWTTSSESSGGPKPPAPDRSAEIAALEAEVNRLTARVKELEDILEYVRKMVNAPEPTKAALEDAIRQLAKRGFVACAESNVALHVHALDGRMEVTLLTPVAARPAGARIGSDDEIASVLGELWRRSRGSVPECRYDYRLTYRTKDDYHDARQRFERYLYPERIRVDDGTLPR